MASISMSLTQPQSDSNGTQIQKKQEIGSLPSMQRALKVRGLRQLEVTEACPLPTLENDEILVRVRSVAINPVDVKTLDMAPNVGATAGCEFAGDIVQVGPWVKNVQLKEGVAVFGVINGNHFDRPENGAWAEFVAVAGDLVYLLPPHLTYQEGASMGAALPTVGMALYYSWDLPRPYPASQDVTSTTDAENQRPRGVVRGEPRAPVTSSYVLVYGGSTTCGAMALQMLRLSGLVPVCTCSPSNFDLTKRLGAEEAFDYHSLTCGEDIRRYTNNSLAYLMDCITDLSSMRICYAAMGRKGGKYMGLDAIPLRAHTRRDIVPDYILVYTMFGRTVTAPRPFGRPARPQDRAFGESWCRSTQQLVDQRKVLPHPHEEGSGRLDGVIDGLDRMRRGDVSGVKLVYELG